jgi:hypothetical protein
LKDKKYQGAKMDALINNFGVIMQTMNEKNNILVKAYLDKAIEVEKKVNSRMWLLQASKNYKGGLDTLWLII